ncbi:MAG TPA: hypothetical protein VFM13_04210 [Gaiellaceae bacterium]|nr:hypothetical protein [Gaiellaceae bacterium]
METLTEVPLRTVHAYQTDEDTVLEIELPVDEPKLTLALDDHTLTVRVPRRTGPERFKMNADVTGV